MLTQNHTHDLMSVVIYVTWKTCFIIDPLPQNHVHANVGSTLLGVNYINRTFTIYTLNFNVGYCQNTVLQEFYFKKLKCLSLK